MSDAWGPAARFYDACERQGGRVIVRRQSKGPIPGGLINPPRVVGAVLSADLPQGAQLVQLAAVSSSGRLVAGDIVVVGTLMLLVLAEAAALPPVGLGGFVNVQVPPVSSHQAIGTPVDFVFKADLAIPAMINSFPRRLVDGDRIRSRDLDVKVPALGLGEVLPAAWSVFVNGREMSIHDAVPVYEQNEIVSWSIQAR